MPDGWRIDAITLVFFAFAGLAGTILCAILAMKVRKLERQNALYRQAVIASLGRSDTAIAAHAEGVSKGIHLMEEHLRNTNSDKKV